MGLNQINWRVSFEVNLETAALTYPYPFVDISGTFFPFLVPVRYHWSVMGLLSFLTFFHDTHSNVLACIVLYAYHIFLDLITFVYIYINCLMWSKVSHSHKSGWTDSVPLLHFQPCYATLFCPFLMKQFFRSFFGWFLHKSFSVFVFSTFFGVC